MKQALYPAGRPGEKSDGLCEENARTQKGTLTNLLLGKIPEASPKKKKKKNEFKSNAKAPAKGVLLVEKEFFKGNHGVPILRGTWSKKKKA